MQFIKKVIFCFLASLSVASIYAMYPDEAQSSLNLSDEIFRKALNVEIKKISHFYAQASDNALNDLIKIANNMLSNNQSLEFYAIQFKKSVPEIKQLTAKIAKKANTRLKFNAAKALRIQNPKFQKPLQTTVESTTKQTKSKKITKQPENCSLYIMLDVPEFNAVGKRIDWEAVIYNLTSNIHDAEFIPFDYRHITLAWHKFKQPLTQAVRRKIARALDQSSKNLKNLYPNGIHGIALLDGAYTLGESAVAFGVAQNQDLIKVITTISEFLSMEGLKGFQFPEIQGESPLHITLGRIVPEKKAYDFKNQIRALNAPSGSRSSQGESFASDLFRVSCSLPSGHQALGEYKF